MILINKMHSILASGHVASHTASSLIRAYSACKNSVLLTKTEKL